MWEPPYSLCDPVARLGRAFYPLEEVEWESVRAVHRALDGEIAKGRLALGAYVVLLRAVEETDRDSRFFLLSQGATAVVRCAGAAAQVNQAVHFLRAGKVQRLEEAMFTSHEYLEMVNNGREEPIPTTLEGLAADELRGATDSLCRALLIKAVRLAGRDEKPVVFNDALHAMRIRGAFPRLLRSLVILGRQFFSNCP